MIASDQPNCFPNDLLVRVSSMSDGTVLDRAVGVHDPDIVTNRTRFCENMGISYGDVVYQRIIYDTGRTYRLIAEVDNGSTTKFTSELVADGLVTDRLGVGLFLPVADCVATVVYDPEMKRLGMFHLGRHSTLAGLASKSVDCFRFSGSKPENLVVWMSPHAQKGSYKLDWFDHESDPDWQGYFEKKPDGYYLDMAGYNSSRMQLAGIKSENIHVSPIDTATDSGYFSHSQGDATGRIGVLAVMR